MQNTNSISYNRLKIVKKWLVKHNRKKNNDKNINESGVRTDAIQFNGKYISG